MLAREKPVIDDILSLAREFEGLASMLHMPQAERRGILNLPASALSSLCSGDVDSEQSASPELMRRLNYAVPLMRQMVANATIVHLPLRGELSR